jgi:hypothetical protein
MIDGAASGVTKRGHNLTLPLLPLHHGKDRAHFYIEIWYMMVSCSLDKILPKQVGYFGTRINWKQP